MQNNIQIEEDEIDLRELFKTIWKHKVFILLFTLLVTAITIFVVYKMQNYYKTTTTIEIKTNDSKTSPLAALGGAASLIGLGNIGGSNDIDKHLYLLKTYKINSYVLNKIDYKYRYFINIKENYKEKEL
jgi:uncharacterized protein involved in exopolysaccharide biosynthesis